MAYAFSALPRQTKLAQLEEALGYVADMIDQRDDGEAYLPIFDRLEAEIATVRAAESSVERARRLSAERRAQQAVAA